MALPFKPHVKQIGQKKFQRRALTVLLTAAITVLIALITTAQPAASAQAAAPSAQPAQAQPAQAAQAAASAGKPAQPAQAAAPTPTQPPEKAPLHNSDPQVQELLDRHAPIVITIDQSEHCDTKGDPFLPMSVEPLLNNREIALRQIGPYDPVKMWGPAASDLHKIGGGFYLDYPGLALKPGCLFETDYRRWVPHRQASVYGRVVTQSEHPNKLAVQYWLFWYFNDWNNRHESDWEFIQIIFDADTVSEALATEPAEVGYSQHYGGERSAWNDKKLTKTEGHPHVHVASRSHASFYGAHLYLGRNAKEGFGCDDTTGKSSEHLAKVIALPDSEGDVEIAKDSPFAWVEFRGRWGERLSGPNNAPYGPRPQDRWTNPITWQNSLRDNSLQIPVASLTSETASTFCRVVATGSTHYINFLVNPWKYVAFALAALVAAIWTIRLTDWADAPVRPLVLHRKVGQLYFAALSSVRKWPQHFTWLLLLSVPITTATALLNAFAERNTSLINTGGSALNSSVTVLAVILNWAISIGGGLLMSASAARMFATEEYELGDARTAITESLKDGWRLIKVGLGCIGIPLALAVTIVGIPPALWLYVRWSHTPALSTQNRDASVRELLSESNRLVKGRTLRSALVYSINFGVVTVLTTVVTLGGLLAVPSSPIWLASTLGTIVGVSLFPFNSYVNALLWGDALSAQTETPAAPGRQP